MCLKEPKPCFGDLWNLAFLMKTLEKNGAINDNQECFYSVVLKTFEKPANNKIVEHF